MDNLLSELPRGILEVEAHQLHQHLADLTLVHLPGKIQRPLFISVLQHGNETTGWQALRLYLKQHLEKLPRSIYLLFGNLSAAKDNIRQRKDGVDFNRCWPGLQPKHHPIAQKMAAITAFIKEQNPIVSIDIHNNSGKNPHYSGINTVQKEHINLASLFSETIVLITSPDGTQSGAFANFCPAITTECGRSGTADGIEQTVTFLNKLSQISDLTVLPGAAKQQQVMDLFAIVKVHSDISLGVAAQTTTAVDFEISQDLDYHNFQLLEVGTVFGTLKSADTPIPFKVTDNHGHDLTHDYFSVKSKQVINHKPLTPAMISLSIEAIRFDCLCYLIRPLNY